uniref:Uncharacterized protein n=1 Tax=Meloidogyne incognita TaxID=6306 RepID=A0A914MPY6_MELIC
MNCSCDFGSNCIRPSLFTKPVLCLHSSINVKNFTKYIANPVNTSTTIIQQQQQLPSTNYYEYNLMWMYFLITFVIILQLIHTLKFLCKMWRYRRTIRLLRARLMQFTNARTAANVAPHNRPNSAPPITINSLRRREFPV